LARVGVLQILYRTLEQGDVQVLLWLIPAQLGVERGEGTWTRWPVRIVGV
jgi:hypothetical protein